MCYRSIEPVKHIYEILFTFIDWNRGIVSEDSEAICDQGCLNVRRSCDWLCSPSFRCTQEPWPVTTVLNVLLYTLFIYITYSDCIGMSRSTRRLERHIQLGPDSTQVPKGVNRYINFQPHWDSGQALHSYATCLIDVNVWLKSICWKQVHLAVLYFFLDVLVSHLNATVEPLLYDHPQNHIGVVI